MQFPFSHAVRAPVRVVITGAGVVTALGMGWEANARGFQTGTVAFGPVTLFDVSRQRTGRAAEVRLPAQLPSTGLSARQEARMERAGRMLLWAASEAWGQAGWKSDGARIPLVLGTTSGGMTLGQEFLRAAVGVGGDRRGQPTRVTHYQPQRQALDLMDAFGFGGPVSIVANACASGANAVGEAFEWIRSGRSSRVVAGGYDALSELVYAGFDALQALSPTTCRPFEAARDGLGLGEGAAVVLMESLESALDRGAPILGEVLGYGAATDGHHLTQPHPQGDAALATMRAACAQAGIGPGEVGYINAHGTGTVLNDGAEAMAISRWAGGDAERIRVSSVKGSIGHLLGGAGAVEVVACLMGLGGGWLPVGVGEGQPDPACVFPLVRKPTSMRVDRMLTNSFGFGGANASVLLGRWA